MPSSVPSTLREAGELVRQAIGILGDAQTDIGQDFDDSWEGIPQETIDRLIDSAIELKEFIEGDADEFENIYRSKEER